MFFLLNMVVILGFLDKTEIQVNNSAEKDWQKMNKKELVATIATSGGMSKVRAGQALSAVLANMVNAMEEGERVTISGFGSFRVVERATQKGRNPRTGESIIIPAHKTVKFKPGKNLNRRVEEE